MESVFFFSTMDVNIDELRIFTFVYYIFELDILDKKLICDVKLCVLQNSEVVQGGLDINIEGLKAIYCNLEFSWW